MDGFTWLLLSWLAVGAFCYFILQKMGATEGTQSVTGPGGSERGAMESTASHVQYSSDGTTLTHRPSPGVRYDYSNHQTPRINVESSMDPRRSSTQDKWVNDFIAWLFNNYKGAPEAANAWLRSLNDASKKVTAPTNCEVLFESFGDHSTVHDAPKLRNIRVEPGPRDHLTFRCEVYAPEVHLKLVSSQRLHDRLLVSNYDARLLDLHGEVQVRIACIANELFLMGCFNGRPEMDVQLVGTDSNAVGRVDASLVEDAIRRCLVSAVTNVTLSGARGHGASGADDAEHHRSSLASSGPVEEMFRRLQQAQASPRLGDGTPPNKLRVKVIRAQRLGGSTDVHQPFVIVEMDDPHKKYATSKGLNISPYWEETFEFELAPTSEEILFEVYEGAAEYSEHPNRFLGLAIVGFEEIRRSGESVHSLTLQGRPYRNDDVSGTITVEFEFFHDPHIAAIGKRIESVVVRNNQGQFTETIAIAKRPLYDPHDNYENHDVMAVPTKTTTVLIKSVSQQPNERAIEEPSKQQNQRQNGLLEYEAGLQKERMGGGKMKDSLWSSSEGRQSLTPTTTSQGRDQAVLPPLATAYTLPRTKHSAGSPAPQIHVNEQPVVGATHERGRSAERKSFFGELRDRLSGRHTKRRPHSVDIGSAASSHLEETVSVPASRDTSETRAGAHNRHYYETSSVGARSGDSSRSLYQHSTLVVELLKNNVRKYYLIPPAVMSEPAATKLMKRGKKLHIFNEHTFVAVRIRGGTVCNVCSRRIGRSFSKQAYQCRDCRMICHKSCHYKTDAFCACSNVSNLQIIRDIDWDHFLTHFQMEEYISADGV